MKRLLPIFALLVLVSACSDDAVDAPAAYENEQTCVEEVVWCYCTNVSPDRPIDRPASFDSSYTAGVMCFDPFCQPCEEMLDHAPQDSDSVRVSGPHPCDAHMNSVRARQCGDLVTHEMCERIYDWDHENVTCEYPDGPPDEWLVGFLPDGVTKGHDRDH